MRLILEIAAGVALGIFAFLYILKLVADFRGWLRGRRYDKDEKRRFDSRFDAAVSQGAPADLIWSSYDLQLWENAYRNGWTERWIANKREEQDYLRENPTPDTPGTRALVRNYRKAVRPWRPSIH